MATHEQEVRFAAETLLQSSNSPQNPLSSLAVDLSHSQSINTVPSGFQDYVISDDFIAGQRFAGRMSSVRRFFCLFVTFDFLFTGLMWLICVMLNGEDVETALKKQIIHYNIHTSLFDIVLAALCRFTILLLFYALLHINHWIIIAISTTLTSAFLISKVFLYDWPASRQPVFEVLLILTSFILSWGETWFLDSKVIPQELFARRFLISSPDSERAPLIRSYVQGLPSCYTESVGNFYSPLQSPEGSIHRFDGCSRSLFSSTSLITREQTPIKTRTISNVSTITKMTDCEERKEYKDKAKQALLESWDILNHPDWKEEKRNSQPDVVYSVHLPNLGKIFKIKSLLDIGPRFLLDELFYRVENIPQWNPTVLESHKIQTIDEHTDITYQISAEGAGGMVRSRDFVNLRHWEFKDEHFVIACIKTEHPAFTQNNKYLRGENNVSCFAMKAHPCDSNKCEFQWVLNSDLKGWIPTKILDSAFVSVMFDYIKFLRQHITKLKEPIGD